MKSLTSLRVQGLSNTLRSAWTVPPDDTKRRHKSIRPTCSEDVDAEGKAYPYCHRKVLKQHGLTVVPIHRVGSKAEVAHGTAYETAGGLRRQDLVAVKKNGVVRYVSKKKREQGETSLWAQAVRMAREELGITGFVKIGGHGATGQEAELYKRSKAILAELKKDGHAIPVAENVPPAEDGSLALLITWMQTAAEKFKKSPLADQPGAQTTLKLVDELVQTLTSHLESVQTTHRNYVQRTGVHANTNILLKLQTLALTARSLARKLEDILRV